MPLEISRKSHPAETKGASTSAFGLKGRELSKKRGKGTRIRVPGAREGRL